LFRMRKHDILVGVNNNQKYDANIDALDDNDTQGAGFLVVPEYLMGAILGLAGCFAELGVFQVSQINTRLAWIM